MKKIKILDTNVFLSDPKALFAFPQELIVIPISVIEEIDEFKKGLNELGRNARYILRKIDKLRKRGKISGDNGGQNKKLPGIELNNKGRLIIELNHTNKMPAGLSGDKVDNRILAVALYYKSKHPKSEVTLITKDANLRIKADALGLKAEDYESPNQTQSDQSFQGYQEIKVSSEELKDFERGSKLSLAGKKHNLFPNEYVILQSTTEPNLNSAGRFNADSNSIEVLDEASDVWGLKALNPQQRFALDALLDPRIPLVTLTGKAGTGKTLLAVAAGLAQTAEQSAGGYSRLLVSRPVFPMGKDIGYLPGPQPLDAKILTPTGWTTMGELKKGDDVISRDGSKSKIINIFKKGIKDIYKITTTDGTSTEACLDHLWFTQTAEDRKRNRPGSVKSTKDMLESLVNNKNKINHFLPRNEAVSFKSKKLPLSPYTLGCLIGDGSLGNALVLSNKDQELINKVNSELSLHKYFLSHHKNSINYNIRSSLFNNKPADKVKITNTLTKEVIIFESIGKASLDLKIKTGILRYNCNQKRTVNNLKFEFINNDKQFQNDIKNIINELGLFKKKSYEKFIPEIYKYSSIENRLEILRGLMDTDGCIKPNGEASFDTTSKQLADDVTEIVKSLGGRASIRTRNRESRLMNAYIDGRKISPRRTSYSVGVSLPKEFNPFYISRKASKHKCAYIHKVGIKSIELVGKKEAQCILIDHPEHLYLTDNFIVTHNTIEEKLNPWMQPIFDNLEFLFSIGSQKKRAKDNRYKELIEQGILQVEPLTYIRGRSIPQQFMIIDEAQNLTLHEIKTIVTRAGKNTKIVFTGDPEQIDNPYVDSQSNGLSQLIEAMKDEPLAAHVNLLHGERSELAEMASHKLN